jgi:nicotinamide riboside transporter PnuC
MVFGLISTYYLAKQRKRGFLFGAIGGLGWITFGILTQSVAGVLANATFIFLNCRGFKRWKQTREEQQTAKCSEPRPHPVSH